MSDIKIHKGKILIYRVYDIGDDIDLEKASRLVEQSTSPLRFKLKHESRAMVVNNAPLTLSLGTWHFNFQGEQVEVESVGKLWHFGVFSLCFMINMREGVAWNELIAGAASLENDSQIDRVAKQKTNDLLSQISKVVKNKNSNFDCYEDYVIHFFETIDGLDHDAKELFEKVNVHALILAEAKDAEILAEPLKASILENTFQYTSKDMAVIDWNSALVIEPSGSMDVPDVIEFALCQLLEMRFYDDVLDGRLANLFDAVGSKKKNFLSNIYNSLAEDAGEKYLEITELIENVENSMKVVGDFYLAKIFRASLKRFRITDWQTSVDNKLKTLAEVSKLLHGESNTKRSHLLEIIIIVLIAVELVPLLREVLKI